MTMKKILISAALAVSTLAPVTFAEAMPLTAPVAKAERQSDVSKVAYVCGRYACRRVYRPYRVYRPRVYVAPAIIAPAIVVRPRVVVRGGSRHVNWCLAHYRSYNPRTNLFVSYGGEYRVCRSPYR